MPLPRPTARRCGPVPAVAVAALLGVIAVSAPAREARADEVSPDGKGIVGGALLGAEVITITESLAGARPVWAYVVGAVVGAGGGGVAGHFIENASTDGKVPMYMLAGGLALIIPAVVLSLNATRWQPEEGATEDNVPTGPAAEPGAVGGSVVVGPPNAPNLPPPPPAAPPGPTPSMPPPAPAPPAPTPPPQSLFDVHGGSLRMGVPVPDVRPVFSVVEQRQYGLLHAETELRMPMLHMTF
jgi:hypothetical protein